jgi:hypothetical protein
LGLVATCRALFNPDDGRGVDALPIAEPLRSTKSMPSFENSERRDRRNAETLTFNVDAIRLLGSPEKKLRLCAWKVLYDLGYKSGNY